MLVKGASQSADATITPLDVKVSPYAPVDRIESYGNHGKYKVLFTESATKLENSIPFDNATPDAIQGPRYTKHVKLFTSNSMSELLININ